MAIWSRSFTLDQLTAVCRGTAAQHCGVRITAFGDGWLEGTVPLDSRTEGPAGTLHPGALAILAETLGSLAAYLCIDTSRQICVGQVIEVNHPEPIRSGPVRARVSALAILGSRQIWNVEMTDALGAKVCFARLTMAILEASPA